MSEKADLGLAGFLRFEEEPDGHGVRAALFSITSLGEPVEFSFTRIEVAGSFLWRAGDAHRHAVTALSKALFEASFRQPTLLLALAEEVPPRVFTEDLEVQVPTCRLASRDTAVNAATVHSATESLELITDTTNLFWVRGPPESDSPARRLIEVLQGRQLLTEPFKRALAGLGEAFNNS